MPASFLIREAQERDSKHIYSLIMDLALFEKAPNEVINTPTMLTEHGWGANPLFKAWVAVAAGNIVGFALCYTRYSTWKGPVLYLEDLYVSESFRKLGIGDALLQKCIHFGKSKKYTFVCFQVLDWNESAIQFYKKYTTNFDSEWINVKIPL